MTWLKRSPTALMVLAALLLGWLAHVVSGLSGWVIGVAAVALAYAGLRRVFPPESGRSPVVALGLLAVAFGLIEATVIAAPVWFFLACLAVGAYFVWRLARPRG